MLHTVGVVSKRFHNKKGANMFDMGQNGMSNGRPARGVQMKARRCHTTAMYRPFSVSPERVTPRRSEEQKTVCVMHTASITLSRILWAPLLEDGN